ncbi:MAG: hypothetical protein WC900_02515 [Oscillospiraceae bacterium]|jgi:hypothetical protein
MNLNPKALEAMLNVVSQKLGTSPEELKKNLESGNVNDVVKGMNDEQSDKLRQALNNRKLQEKIMSSPEAQELMKKLSGEGKKSE